MSVAKGVFLLAQKKSKEIHFRITEELYQALDIASVRIGVTKAWLVHHATEKYLSEKGYLKK